MLAPVGEGVEGGHMVVHPRAGSGRTERELHPGLGVQVIPLKRLAQHGRQSRLERRLERALHGPLSIARCAVPVQPHEEVLGMPRWRARLLLLLQLLAHRAGIVRHRRRKPPERRLPRCRCLVVRRRPHLNWHRPKFGREGLAREQRTERRPGGACAVADQDRSLGHDVPVLRGTRRPSEAI